MSRCADPVLWAALQCVCPGVWLVMLAHVTAHMMLNPCMWPGLDCTPLGQPLPAKPADRPRCNRANSCQYYQCCHGCYVLAGAGMLSLICVLTAAPVITAASVLTTCLQHMLYSIA